MERSSSSNEHRVSAAEALRLIRERREGERIEREFDSSHHLDNELHRRVANELRGMVLSVLKLPEAEFSSTTSLLDYGLDSIAAVEIGTLFTDSFGLTLPPTVFFEFPDVSGFSRYLVENYRLELKARYRVALAMTDEDGDRRSRTKHDEPPVVLSKSLVDNHANNCDDDSHAKPTAEEPVDIEELWSGKGSSCVRPTTARDERPVRQPDRAELQAMQRIADQARLLKFKRQELPDLECAVYGEGPPLLMLGGLLMVYNAMWRPQLEALGARYTLVMFHMPGSGTLKLDADLSLASLTRDVRDLLDALKIAEPLPVVGCSFGGVLAQAFCLAHPERVSALLLAVTTPVAEGATDFTRLMKELQSSSSFMEVNRGWPMQSLPAYSGVIEGFDLRDALGRITVPALVIAGGRDQYTPASHGRMISALIPHAEYIEVADAGHLLPFTHYDLFNAHVLRFLAASLPRREASSGASSDAGSFAPLSPATLAAAEAYVQEGRSGHCVSLSPVAAQTALLISHLCNRTKDRTIDYRSYFVTSFEEAFDAAVRLTRHYARNRRPHTSPTAVLFDPNGRWKNYIDPLKVGPEKAFLPGIHVAETSAEALRLSRSLDGVAALICAPRLSDSLEDIEALLAYAGHHQIASVFVESDERSDRLSWQIDGLECQPDIVVFGDRLTCFQVPIGACAVRSKYPNPWLMTPNEGYVRQPMAAMGFPVTIAYEYLRRQLKPDTDLQSALDAIIASPARSLDAHLRFANVGYARVAHMHGYDGTFQNARGMRSEFIGQDGLKREIVDCLLNVGTCPRGLNPTDTIAEVFRVHRPENDYWSDLETFLTEKTGYDTLLPAASQTGAIEAGLTLGLMAARTRTKLLCFSGGAGFSMIAAMAAHDPVYDLFRKPFGPLYRDVVFIDPAAPDAERQLRMELSSGEVGLVWLETIQVEGNAVRPLPRNLLRAVDELRDSGGYLVGVDETQTNLWTGPLLHSFGKLRRPDLIAIASSLCDSLLPAGAVLTSRSLLDRARHVNSDRVASLRTRYACQLTAHLALHALRLSVNDDASTHAADVGRYFREELLRLKQEFSLLKEVRGEGLLLAIEFDLAGQSAFVQRSFGYLLWGAMLRDPEGGVAIIVCPIHNHSLRIIPSLSITRSEIEAIIANLRRRLARGVEAVIRDCAAYNESLGEQRTARFLLTQIEAKPNNFTGSVVTMDKRIPGADTDNSVRPLKARQGLPTVCIIGAGVGGIAMAGALKKKGIPFDCFDKRDRLGGIWAFDDKKENTSVWHALNMNTPSGWYQFSDYPMPPHYPDFPQWHQVQSYLEGYVDHCNMRSSFHLGHEVQKADRLESGRWRIILANGEVRDYDALVVANGHHNTPNFPAYAEKSNFAGAAIHSQKYRYRHDYKDKRVMIVGVGNSGAQIAVDVSQDAKMTYISLRRGVYLLPHYMFGVRVDKVLGVTLTWWFKKLLPGKLYPMFFTGVYHLLGNHRQIGMPKPDHWMMTCLPTVTESLANRIGDGKIKIVPEVKSIDGSVVHFEDGKSLEIDAIIYSTGYQTTLPFFDKDFFEVHDNKVPLFKRVFLPGVPNLAFVGMFQAIRWGFLDVMENQAKLISEYFAGGYQLPSVDQQKDDIGRERKAVEAEFMHTLRNNYYLHGDTYVRELNNELHAGQKRARQSRPGVPTPCGGDVVSRRDRSAAPLITAAE